MENPPSIVPDLLCEKCKWPLIKNGELKCQRSGHTVQATLGTKSIFCPYCRKPKVLLADKSGRAICPQCKSRTRTLTTEEVNQMVQVTGKQETAQDQQEEKVSRTQELRDWLDNEINRAAETVKILYDAVSSLDASHTSSRYKTLTPDERDSQVEKDKKTLESSNKLMELLRSARSLDVDIDALEKMGFIVNVVKTITKNKDLLISIRARMQLNEYDRTPTPYTYNEYDQTLGRTPTPYTYKCVQNLELSIYPHQRFFEVVLDGGTGNVSSNYHLHNVNKLSINESFSVVHYIKCWHRSHAEGEQYLLQIRKSGQCGKIFINTTYTPASYTR